MQQTPQQKAMEALVAAIRAEMDIKPDSHADYVLLYTVRVALAEGHRLGYQAGTDNALQNVRTSMGLR